MTSGVSDNVPPPEGGVSGAERPPTRSSDRAGALTRQRVVVTLIVLVVVGVLAWVVFGIGLGHLLEKILHLPAWLILLLVFLLPGLEASVFLGVFFPARLRSSSGALLHRKGRSTSRWS